MSEQALRHFMERRQYRAARSLPKEGAWKDKPVLGRAQIQQVGVLGAPLPKSDDLAEIVLDLLAGADDPPLHNEAQALARAGRGGDTEIAHVTPGELVVPKHLQTPEVIVALKRAASGAPLERMQVGHPRNRINPRTGAAEFDDEAPDQSGASAIADRISQSMGRLPNLGSADHQTMAYGTVAYGLAPLRVDPSQIEEIDVQATPLPAGTPYSATYQQGRDPVRPDIVYKYPDGSTETMSGGTAAWRMNNPGNLHYQNYGNALKDGAIGTGGNGNAIFPDQDTGLKAFDNLLKSNTFRGAHSLDKFVETYAGKTNPDVPNYQNMIGQVVGVPGATPISDLTPEQWGKLRNGLLRFENTTRGTRSATFPERSWP